MNIVDRIKQEAKLHNMTIAFIERTLNISNGTISKWNERNPSAETLYRVANLLNVSVEYLITGYPYEINMSPDERMWLNLYNELSLCEPSIKNECIGFVKGYIERGKLNS